MKAKRSTRHVYPIGDLREHDTDGTEPPCWCQPRCEVIRTEAGKIVGYLISHNSADGRELVERHGLQ